LPSEPLQIPLPHQTRAFLWLALSLFVAATTWLYVHRILNPWRNYLDLEKDKVIAQMGDLYSPWVGAREVLLHRRNPYGPEVTREIQVKFYGHQIHQNYVEEIQPINEQRFAYPVYTVFLLAPTVYADFEIVQRWASFALASFVIFTVLFSLNILRWRPPWKILTAIILFTLSSPQIVHGLRHQQLAVVVGFLLTAGAWCVTRNHLATAGVLLALSTIKPQMALLPLCWFLIWALGSQSRWRLPAAFLATLSALIGAGELILPGWLAYFLAGIAAYRKYAPTSSLLRVALGDTLGEILGALLIAGLLVFAGRNRKAAGDSASFTVMLASFFMTAVLVFPLFTPYNQVILILPALLALRGWKSLPRFSRLVFFVITGWPWIVSLALLLRPPNLNSPNQTPLLPSFLVSFVPLLLPLLLMTKRTETSPPADFVP